MTAAEFVPQSRSLRTLAEAARGCHGCDLYKNATQTVFGEGPKSAQVVFVGEQPGDLEDQEGRPFVGPAGRYFDKMLDEAGIDRGTVYVTNAVKHFKWTPQGNRRLHKKPSARELTACRPWLEAELDAIRPEVLVCLGATAAQTLLGRDFRITRQHGEIFESDWAPVTTATWHPSAILRAPDETGRATMKQEFLADLRAIARHLDRKS